MKERCHRLSTPMYIVTRQIIFIFLLITSAHFMIVDAFQRSVRITFSSQAQRGNVRTIERTTTTLVTRARNEYLLKQRSPSSSSRKTTELYFMGTDSGILGVGGPEVFTIILVGYFVLGPSDLYKLVKEIGKFIQNIRTLGTDLSTTFENNMESSLQLEELRKAQRELSDAFSFRRTINVDADSEAFSVQAGSAQKAEAEAAIASTAVIADPSAPPKKIRRRIRKKEVEPEDTQSSVPINNISDLEMPTITNTVTNQNERSISDDEASIIESEFNQYVMNPSVPFDDWDSWNGDEEAKLLNSNVTATPLDPATDIAARSRFQQQLSGNWNDQILSAGDKLEPMAVVMNKIALLEQEKAATLQRLEDEFAKRTEVEEKYYKEQRKVLEEAVSEVQSAAFGLDSKTII